MASQAGHITDRGQEYRRDVGTLGVVFLVVNGLIGSGIFGLPELLHQAVGTFAPWLMLAAAALIASVFFCFAELGRLTDRSGGPQRFVTDAFGSFPGFQVGWLWYFGRMVAHAANVTVLVSYAAALWPVLGGSVARSCAIVLIIGLVTVLNVVGIKRAVSVLGALTLFKLAPLVLLVGVVLVANPSMKPVLLPQFSAVEGVTLAALYAFIGCENATIPAGETKDPKKAVPRALLISLAIVGLIYIGLQFAYSNSSVAGTGSEAPLAALAGHYTGNFGSLLIAATVIVSVLGNSVAGHTIASRVTAALSDDGLIPRWFGLVSKWGTPANSIVFFGLGALLFALTGSFVALAISSTLARLLVYIASIGALPRLRRLVGLDAFTVPLGVAAGIALSLCVWASSQSSRATAKLSVRFPPQADTRKPCPTAPRLWPKLQDAAAAGLSSLARLNLQAVGPRGTVTIARRTSVTFDRRLGIAAREFEGHKVEEVEGAPFSLNQADVTFASRPAAPGLLWRQLCEDC